MSHSTMLCRWIFLLLAVTCAAQTPIQPAHPQSQPEHKISEAEAKELFASVDEVMRFASSDSGLPMRSSVKRRLVSRDEVEKLLTERMNEDKDTQRFERSELILKKFGMLPADFSLRPFLLKLLREQVAGFYDVKEKTINLLDWLPSEAQRPVLAHELTHALQDQQIGLEKWQDEPEDQEKADIYNQGIRSDEASFARTAVTEGQAMIVLWDYLLLPTGRTLLDTPTMLLTAHQLAIPTESTLGRSPVVVRDSLIFPYREGMDFVYEVLLARKKGEAFADMLQHPPTNSHEILEPQSYLKSEPQPEAEMPDLGPILRKRYAKFDSGAVGEFDVRLLLKTFNVADAVGISSKWTGGMYYAGQRDTRTPVKAKDIALLYVSGWQNAAAAAKFRSVYESLLPQRYGRMKKDGDFWKSNAGPLRVAQYENTVVVCEGFDKKTTDALMTLLKSGKSQPKVALDHGELSFALGADAAALLHAAGLH